MEEKSLIKEMLYLGTGLSVQGLNKIKEMAGHFLQNNEDARKQGEAVIDDLISKSRETTEDLHEKVDNIAKQIAEKSAMAKEEVTGFIHALIEKPTELQAEAKQKFQEISDSLAHHGHVKKQEALLWLEELKAEILENRDLAKSKVDEIAHKLSSESKNVNEKGKLFIQDIAERSTEIKGEFDDGLHKALDRFLSKMNLSRVDRIDALEKRIDSLESKN